MSVFYHCTLTKPAAINGREIFPGTPLLIDLFTGETPTYYTVNTKHKVYLLSIGNPLLIGEICLRDVQPLIKWGNKRGKK